MPPTLGALFYKILRSHFVSLVLRTCNIPKPLLPNPIEYGWKDAYDNYEAIMTDEKPAPEAVIEMRLCGCTTGCTNNRCRCFKSDLVCTEMCHCINCDNCVIDYRTNIEETQVLRKHA